MLGSSPPPRGLRPNPGAPPFAQDSSLDAAALAMARADVAAAQQAYLGMGMHGYGAPGGFSGGAEGSSAACMPAGPMPSAPMPSGPPQMRHAPPPPPRHSPPTVPPGMALGSHDEQRATLASAQEMLAVVSQRVAPMLQAAARHSETQVSTELRKLDALFRSLRDKAVRVDALLSARDSSARQLPKDGIAKMLLELENRRDQEIKALKRELHQTILAHNHNADLMADHKTAIDAIRAGLDERGPPVRFDEDPQLHETLTRLGSTLERNTERDQAVDMILQRGELLLQRYAESMATPMPSLGGMSAHAGYHQGQAFNQGYSHMLL